MKPYEEMTREERAELLLKDPDAYTNHVPLNQGYWFQILDGVAKAGPIELEDEE